MASGEFANYTQMPHFDQWTLREPPPAAGPSHPLRDSETTAKVSVTLSLLAFSLQFQKGKLLPVVAWLKEMTAPVLGDER